MFNFRLMLPILGVLGTILGAHSYSYGYAGAPVYGSEASASYEPQSYSTYTVYPQSQPNYGNNVYGSYQPGANYGYNSCGANSVVEFLDALFCQQSIHQRYSSKAYPVIDVVIAELSLVTKCAPLKSVVDKLESSIKVLTDLQDATYENFGESSLVRGTNSYGVNNYNYTSATTTNPCDAISKLEADLKVFEDRRQGFVKDNGFITTEEAQAEAAQAQAKELQSQKQTVTVVNLSPHKTKRSRFTRGVQNEDSSCAYIPSYNSCSVNFSALLANILTQIQKALEINIAALTDLKNFLLPTPCNDATTKYPLLVAADTFGTILTASDILLEVFKYICKVHEGITVSYGYPASGYPSTSMPVSSGPLYRAKEYAPGIMPRLPPSQGYSYGYNGYSGQQYRIGRAVSLSPRVVPTFFLVGR